MKTECVWLDWVLLTYVRNTTLSNNSENLVIFNSLIWSYWQPLGKWIGLLAKFPTRHDKLHKYNCTKAYSLFRHCIFAFLETFTPLQWGSDIIFLILWSFNLWMNDSHILGASPYLVTNYDRSLWRYQLEGHYEFHQLCIKIMCCSWSLVVQY